MNPAVLVILWIRLSVTFGYPATLQDIQTISKIFGDTQVSKGIIDTFDQSSSEPSTYTSPFNLISHRTHDDDVSHTSTSSADDPFPVQQRQRIISIVRVSSTSVVKPKIVVNKSNEISVSVKSKNKTVVGKFENYVTPFVSHLRKNRLDVDEDVPKIATSSASLSIDKDRSSFALRPQSLSFSTSTSTAAVFSSLRRKSKSTSQINDTSHTADQEDYVDDTTVRIVLKNPTVGAVPFDDAYDMADDEDQESTAPESVSYGESDSSQQAAEPERVYGEPERVYGEPERVYGEPERTYGESEKNYEESEKAYKPDDIVTADESPDDTNDFKLPEGSSEKIPILAPAAAPPPSLAKSYASYTTKLNDKKSSYIVDNGTYRKYRVEEKTADGFIVGEYGMVSHQDGSLRGVRYTADSNINPSLIYETLVKFLSLK